MTVQAPLPDNCLIARYSPQRIPEFRGNPLIEALPPLLSDAELLDALVLLPEFAPEQRDWPTAERLMMLTSLSNFMVPMGMHLELGRTLDSMLRMGYVGRAPMTVGHTKIFQAIYERQHQGVPYRQSASSRCPQISSALIGISGMGKTTTVERWCRQVPQVIYHPDLHLYQVTYLHVEMPSDGSSIKGLALAILHQLDALIPGASYYRDFAQKGRTGADSLMRAVARVMNMHLVGLLICDEVQNLAHAHKGTDTVMTELVSASNELRVPLLLIGTNKAVRVLSHDFREARRATGHGLAPWDRLRKGEDGELTEWDDLLETLWTYQWINQPVPLNHLFRDLMYDYSQGVIDLAVKIFAASQARAIADGSETLTPEILTHVFKTEFKLMHPMLDALRNDDLEALARFDDIAPIDLGNMIDRMARRVQAAKTPLYSVKGSDPTYTARLAAAVTSLGMAPGEVVYAVESFAEQNPNATLLQGANAVLEDLTLPRPIARKKERARDKPVPVDAFDETPDDYRRAIAAARHSGATVMSELLSKGMAPRLDDVVKF